MSTASQGAEKKKCGRVECGSFKEGILSNFRGWHGIHAYFKVLLAVLMAVLAPLSHPL